MSNQALIVKPLFGAAEEMVTLDEALRIGDVVAKSKLFPEIVDQAKAAIAILAGRELGIPPMASLRGIHVVKGKVEIGAGLIAAMIRSSGRYDYRVVELTEKVCRLAWSDNGAEVGPSSFTMEEARRAKLIKPDSNWEKFPKAMLFARAMTAGQKLYAPEIGIGAVYAPGEIAELDAIDITAEPVAEPTAREIFDTPRPLPDSPLPAAWTDDSAARQLADQQIANTINKGLKKISDEIAAEAPAPLAPGDVDKRAQQIADEQAPSVFDNEPMPPDNRAEQIADARERHIGTPAEPDPVPALKPTLSAAQQKVSDAVMSAWKEHKKDKKAMLEIIGGFLGRPVKASKELTDDEAERVFTHLQTLASQWSAGFTGAPTKTVHNQKNPAHSIELSKALDQAFKRLTVLGVPFGPLSQEIADLIEREVSGRKIETRYDMDNDEAQAALEFLQARILDREKELAEKTAEA